MCECDLLTFHTSKIFAVCSRDFILLVIVTKYKYRTSELIIQKEV